MDKSKFLSLINKTKISISNDDTRHYLNGIFIHLTGLKINLILQVLQQTVTDFLLAA